MSIRFLADENLDDDIIRGLRSREPAIDLLSVKTAGLRRTADPALLEIAARQNRVLITFDRTTISRYFRERIEAHMPSPGVFIVPQRRSAIGEIIESLLLIWTASEPEEWRDQIVYLPYP